MVCSRFTIGASVAFLFTVGLSGSTAFAQKQKQAPPKVVVVAIFDQMRADYLTKWDAHFGQGGFKRLKREGAWFSECHYPYAYTLTAPGHTSMATGTTPSVHGIISNDWWQRLEEKEVQSISPPESLKHLGYGPYRRRVGTVGDQLLGNPRRKGRVFGIAIKDRAAILMAAFRAFFCYWFVQGNFETSAYYGERKRSWVEEFNKAKHADVWLDKEWDRFRKDPMFYDRVVGPDEVPAEGVGFLQTNKFPHPFVLNPAAKNPKENFYQAIANSPVGSELLWKFAKAAIQNESIGQGEDTDLLFLGFSSNDYIGHCWGPNSHEVFDITLRTDALIEEMLNHLDEKIGKGNYAFLVSADHGVCPIPELKRIEYQQNKLPEDADVLTPDYFQDRPAEFMNKTFLADGSADSWFEKAKKTNGWITFRKNALVEKRINPVVAQRKLADWYMTQPAVLEAYTRYELDDRTKPLKGIHGNAVRLSYHPEESGDVFVVLKPYRVIRELFTSKSTASYRTTHGSPHRYDTHVPFLVMGPRVLPGERMQPTSPLILANVIADLIQVERLPYGAASPAGLMRKAAGEK